jgi:hypothetical protein
MFVVGPISLHLTLKNPRKWDIIPLSHPEIKILGIQCATKAVVDSPSYPYTICAAEADKYTAAYDVSTPANEHGKPATISEYETPAPSDPAAGIIVNPLWHRTYPSADPAVLNETNTSAHWSGRPGAAKRGWAMQFWVPVPTRLFAKRETRAFRVDARIAVWGNEVHAPGAEMSISHLMREREMN